MREDETMVKVLEDAACHAELIAAMYGMPKEEIAAARKEREEAREAVLSALRAARKDSERLDWLEDRIIDAAGSKVYVVHAERSLVTLEAWGADEFRSIIDAAMSDAAALSSESREGTTNG